MAADEDDEDGDILLNNKNFLRFPSFAAFRTEVEGGHGFVRGARLELCVGSLPGFADVALEHGVRYLVVGYTVFVPRGEQGGLPSLREELIRRHLDEVGDAAFAAEDIVE